MNAIPTRLSPLGWSIALFLASRFPAGAASLTASFAAIPQGSNVVLTVAGPVDWVHWGLYTETSLDRKAGVAPLISDFTLLDAINGFAYVYEFADNYKKWVAQLDTTLRGKLALPGDHIIILTENGTGPTASTREGVAGALAALQKRVTSGDTLLIVLIGHGTADSAVAKFNLVGPDWDTKEWKQAAKTRWSKFASNDYDQMIAVIR